MPSFFFLLDVPEVPVTMTVDSEATSEALAAASESVSTAAVIVYLPTLQPTSEPVSTSAPTAEALTAEGFISNTNFQYVLALCGGIFILMCMVILYQYSKIAFCMASISKDGKQGSSNSKFLKRLFKKRAADRLSEREREALKERFATDAREGELSGHALAATSVNGLLRLGGLERFEDALREIGVDDSEFFFDGHTLDDDTLTRMVGLSKEEVLRLREVLANAEKPSETLETLFKMIDLDGSGSVTKEDTIAAADKLNMTADQATKLFEALGKDGSGNITKNQFVKNFRFSISKLSRDGVSLPGPMGIAI